jgi:predicted nucleic acid-binding protein
MPYYLDTSAFLKLVVEERDSAALRAWAEDDERELFSCDLLRTEALRTARRHSTDALREARARLDVVTIVEVSTAICERAADLDPAILRSLDALHLAAALAVGSELEGVVTYDDRLAAASALHGVAVIAPSG